MLVESNYVLDYICCMSVCTDAEIVWCGYCCCYHCVMVALK